MKAEGSVPWLEWVAAGVGLVLTLGVFGMIGWQAVSDGSGPPEVIVDIEAVDPVDGGYRVLFRARNRAGEAAAQVEIEGKVSAADGKEETGRAILDYIPGNSSQQGGLFFTKDPRSGSLGIRATGFTKP